VVVWFYTLNELESVIFIYSGESPDIHYVYELYLSDF